jgi:ABC-type hemin transport system substrate-binding protein
MNTTNISSHPAKPPVPLKPLPELGTWLAMNAHGLLSLAPDVLIAPDPCSVVAASSCEVVAGGARRDRDDRILVSL